MTWLSEVPRHLNRGFLVSTIIHYSSRIACCILLIAGFLVASASLLITFSPIVIILVLGSKCIRWIKLLAIHRRFPFETAFNTHHHFVSDENHHSDYIAHLKTLNRIVNEQEIIQKLHYQFQDQKRNCSKEHESLFKCIQKRRYGLPVWSPELNFNFRNHVFSLGDRHNGRIITETNIKKVVVHLCRRVPDSCRSPWEICLFYFHSPFSRKPDCTAVLIRAHHHLSKTCISPMINLLDQQLSHSPTIFSLAFNQNQIRPIFSKHSATKLIFKKVANKTLTTINNYKIRCDPNVPNLETNSDPLWITVRMTVKIIKSCNQKLQKFNDSFTELGLSSTYRISWARSASLVNLAPRLLFSALDRLWDIQFSNLVYSSLYFTSLCLNILYGSIRKVINAFQCFFTWINDHGQNYNTVLLKQSFKEIHFTFKSVILLPYLLFSTLVSKESVDTIFPSNYLETSDITMAWSEPLTSKSVQLVAESSGCSFFQVLLCAVTGALSRYIKDNNLETPHVNISVPVYGQNQLWNEKNENCLEGYLNLKFPISGILNNYHRLKIIKATMAAPNTQFGYFLSSTFHKYLEPHLPSFLLYVPRSQQSLKLFCTTIQSKHTVQTACDKDVDSTYTWKMCKDPSMSLVVDRDRVVFIVTGNKNNLPRPDLIVNSFIREFSDLQTSIINHHPKPSQL